MPPWLETSIYGITIFVMLVGLLGLVVPIYPGIFIMWLAALGFGIVVEFNTLGIIIFVLLTLLMIAGVTVDNVLMGVGARRGGASWVTILLTYVAGIIGTIIWPPLGGLLAAPLTLLLLEYSRVGDWKLVWQSVRGLATGWGLSWAVRLIIGLVMFGLWVVWALFR